MQLQHDKTAVIVVDMLNEYLSPEGRVPSVECRSIIPQVSALLEYARSVGMLVVYSNTSLTGPADTLVRKWGEHAIRGTWGADVVPELLPQAMDVVVPKHTYDGFQGTELESVLTSRSIDTVIVVGIHTHVCVLLTAAGAFYRGFSVVALEDCMTTPYGPNHESRLRFFKTHLGELACLDDILST